MTWPAEASSSKLAAPHNPALWTFLVGSDNVLDAPALLFARLPFCQPRGDLTQLDSHLTQKKWLKKRTTNLKSVSWRPASAFQTQHYIQALIWSSPSPLKPLDVPIEKALFSDALSRLCFGVFIHLHMSRGQRAPLCAGTVALPCPSKLVWKLSSFAEMVSGTASCWKCMWTTYLWSSGRRSTKTRMHIHMYALLA